MAQTVAITNWVTGNVGSCKTEISTVSLSAFTLQDIATNSCTGEVMTYPEHIWDGILFGGFILSGFILFLVFMYWIANW